MQSKFRKRSRWWLPMLVASVFFGAAAAQGQTAPPLQNLYRAKQSVMRAQVHVNMLIVRAQGGDGGGDACSRFETAVRCNQVRGCRWVGSYNDGYCTKHSPHRGPHRVLESGGVDVAFDEDAVDENDIAAAFALQGMGAGLTQLGQTIDVAIAHYGTAGFWAPWSTACTSASTLYGANQAAKVSAALPLQGLISPADFIPNDTELIAVRTDLWCP